MMTVKIIIKCKLFRIIYKFQNIFYTRHLSSTEKVDLTSEEWFNMLQYRNSKMIGMMQHEALQTPSNSSTNYNITKREKEKLV